MKGGKPSQLHRLFALQLQLAVLLWRQFKLHQPPDLIPKSKAHLSSLIFRVPKQSQMSRIFSAPPIDSGEQRRHRQITVDDPPAALLEAEVHHDPVAWSAHRAELLTR